MNIQTIVVALACGLALAVPAQAQETKQAPKQAAAKALPAQSTYPTPEAASKALYDAVKSDDVKAIYAVLGPGSGPVIFSGDRVADDALRDDLISAWDRSLKIEREGDAKATLLVGANETPFPFPLVKDGNAWRFDAKAGAEESVNRRIGQNELSAMKVCLAFVDAQREYAEFDRDGNGLIEYAQKLISSPGKKDGLYWPTKAGEPVSPLGPFAVQAQSEGYGAKGGKSAKGQPRPGSGAYHGYRARLLTAQGKDAKGGAYSYLANGKLIGGFGVALYPARYGVSGVMTFTCNLEGVVYEKDLGPATAEIAKSMTTYNPDASWKKTDVK
ncbi:MAG TPA: DUF2950 domain-containing protein [Casimicrobiaceae bacterium]|jgi:hypothetical protein